MRPSSRSPPSHSSTTSMPSVTSSPPGDGRRVARIKESYKHGHRLHGHDYEKAPYPLSYDKHVLELEALDNRLVKHLRQGSVSFINFDVVPDRVLDLGCGTGTWVVDAAKEWRDCSFVGFDLMDIQVPHKVLDPDIAERITWVHGNFLTTKLPFEDDEFDHVHIQSIARGVPENKWGVLFEELNRVIRPGGSIEILEDDVIFPRLPRWFTAPLRSRPRRGTSVHYPEGSRRSESTPTHGTDLKGEPMHEHALLESLYKSVFEHRFINMRPSALLPNYITTYFRHVTLGPIVGFPMPPLPPLLPLPEVLTTFAFDTRPDSRLSSLMPALGVDNIRPISLSFSSTLSASTADSSVRSPSLFSTITRPKSTSVSSDSATSDINDAHDISLDDARKPLNLYVLEGSLSESAIAAIPPTLFPVEQLASLNERSLAMHLYRSYQMVLACQEALWEELKDRIRDRRDELIPFGWDDEEEFEELQNRKKFELLINRYRSDMQARISFWCSLSDMGWPFPPRDPFTKAEIVEEERVREAIMEARRYASSEDLQVPCRTLRVLVGYKS